MPQVYLKGLHASIHKLMFDKAGGHADLSIASEDVVWWVGLVV